jgi:hypothetical protein
MQRDQILGILRHCYKRQADSGPESAFRFLSYAGPNRIPLSADYPRPGLTEETNTHTAKDKRNEKDTSKDKGKGRDNGQLNNLLPLPRSFTPNPPGATDAQDEWVRIDMQQMIKLRNMGHEPRGPVNGPNEGLPEYEVPKSWLHLLAPRPSLSPSQVPTRDRAFPSLRPIPSPHIEFDNEYYSSAIDPALLGNANAVAGPSSYNYRLLLQTRPRTRCQLVYSYQLLLQTRPRTRCQLVIGHTHGPVQSLPVPPDITM